MKDLSVCSKDGHNNTCEDRLYSELLTLMQQTHHFLLSQKEDRKFFEEMEEVICKIQSKSPVKTAVIRGGKVQEISPKKESGSTKKESIPPLKIAEETTKLDEMKLLFQRHNPSQFRKDLPSFIQLITTNASSLPFFQKLTRAITEEILPAKFHLCLDEKEIYQQLSSPDLKILLSPLSEIQHLIKVKGEIHKLTKIDNRVYRNPPKFLLDEAASVDKNKTLSGPTLEKNTSSGDFGVYWIPLYLYDNYLKDPALKRSLWNMLKNLPFDDLLA